MTRAELVLHMTSYSLTSSETNPEQRPDPKQTALEAQRVIFNQRDYKSLANQSRLVQRATVYYS